MNSHASLNRFYRIVWNSCKCVWQAVAENAGGRSRPGGSSAVRAVAFITLTTASAAHAAPLPTGGTVVAGNGTISQSGTSMTVTQTSSKLAVNWDSFSVDQGYSVNFVQPSASAIALNRVIGSDVSVIQGRINAKGQVTNEKDAVDERDDRSSDALQLTLSFDLQDSVGGGRDLRCRNDHPR